MLHVYLWIVLAPLVGALIAGLFGRVIGRSGAHWVTILAVAVSTVLSVVAYYDVVVAGNPGFNGTVYTWGVVGDLEIAVGFLIDELSVTMMAVVTFVSLMVHIYTIGYMRDDPGYQRFFSYISLFTFAMLMLVMSNNFMQLFFGWEAVGVVSYLLIGFWFDRESAIRANLKAFLVNRVGDFGFLLGIACLFAYTGSLHYVDVFAAAPRLSETVMPGPWGAQWPVLAFACICLFVGAMGKSAQFPPPRLAAGFDGRPHPDIGPHPRRHHGDRGHLHGGADVAAVRVFGGRAQRGARRRGDHGLLHGAARTRPARHQGG